MEIAPTLITILAKGKKAAVHSNKNKYMLYPDKKRYTHKRAFNGILRI